MAAPKPQPTVVRTLHGNPGKRRLPKSEPKPPAIDVALSAPSHLGAEAAAEWHDKVALLRSMRLLTKADLGQLSAWCSAYGDFVQSATKLNEQGLVIEDAQGVQRRNPWVMVKTKAIEQMMRIGSEFGFTPASRPKIGRGGVLPLGEGDNGNPSAAAGPINSLDDYLGDDPATTIQ
jgi:P27 family predicted phage terminase small subunit